MPTETTSSTELCASSVPMLPWVRNVAARSRADSARTAHITASTPAIAHALRSRRRAGARWLGSQGACGGLLRVADRRRRPTASCMIASWVIASPASSPASRPSRSTSTRSARRTTSGRSRRREHDGVAARRQVVDQRVDLGLRADVDAAGRLVEQQHARRELSHLPITTFCWLPPDRVATSASQPRHLDREVAKRATAPLARRAARRRRRRATGGRATRARGCRTTDRPSTSPAPCGPRGRARGRRRSRRAASAVADGGRRRGCAGRGRAVRTAEQRGQRRGAAGAHRARERDDLARVHGERQRLDDARGRAGSGARRTAARPRAPARRARRRGRAARGRRRAPCRSSSRRSRSSARCPARMPTSSPSRSTATRSHSAAISSSRCEM